MKRWIMVSNRLPLSHDPITGETRLSSGGLVSALTGIRNNINKLWIGLDPKSEQLLSGKEGEIEYQGVAVNEDLYHLYYNGLSNDVLWPLFHYEGGMVHFNREEWQAYRDVNQLLANSIDSLIQDDQETVWVHDFHLFLLPAMLRKLRPNIRIGFFLHIPFPSSEIFRQLPVRDEILTGILGADLIGFHDYSYLRHFCNTIYSLLGINSDMVSADYQNRRISLGAFPVSIDTASFQEAAKQPIVERLRRKYKKNYQVILGVDRLDYIKGLPLKLKAFRELLSANPHLVGKVQLIQIAIPTRQDVTVYQKLKEEVERLVGEINGKFGSADYVPIVYIYNTVPFDELLSLYRLADCLLVTSRRDGMNLVALEFIAAQSPATPGVVVISEFAGASATLSHALKINPWDIEQTAEILNTALSLTIHQRRNQHKPMIKYLESYDATNWAASFMTALYKTREFKSLEKLIRLDAQHLPKNLQTISKHPKLIVTDYDGTLVPFASRPEDATLPKSVADQLRKFIDAGHHILVVSGRSASFLDQQFSNLNVSLAAEHGAVVKLKRSSASKWRSLVTTQIQRWYPTAWQMMKDYSSRVPESHVERKKYAIVWHFRESPATFASYMALKLAEELAAGLANQPVEILAGNHIVEARAIEANKGMFLRWFLKEHPQFESNDDFPSCIVAGDDRTDEDLFKAVDQERCLTIKIGPGISNARYRVDTPDQYLEIMNSLLL